MRYFANMRSAAIGELLGLSAEQVDSKVNLCFAEIEHAMRVCGEYEVLLAQMTSALLCVVRNSPPWPALLPAHAPSTIAAPALSPVSPSAAPKQALPFRRQSVA